MIQLTTYRDNGAIGALLDEYEKAIIELVYVLSGVGQEAFAHIVDPETSDPDCKSIQTIVSHVLRAGYNYIIAMERHLGSEVDFKKDVPVEKVTSSSRLLKDMFDYNVTFFENNPDADIKSFDDDNEFVTSWGKLYDMEQIFEHAIVHVLRHRRQIERFILKLTDAA